MTARILQGKEVAEKLRQDLEQLVKSLSALGSAPLLVVVVVGDAAPSQAYIKGISKSGDLVGVAVRTDAFPADITQAKLVDHLETLNDDPRIHGIILMRPLPAGLDEKAVARIISPEKDVDCLNPINAGLVMAGDRSGFPPATPRSVIEILQYYGFPLAGREAVVIGRSMVVGRPAAMLLVQEDATVTLCHSRTTDLAAVCRRADIVVAAAGQPGLVTAAMVKPGAVVVDVGINFVEGKMVGDVDFAAVSHQAQAITPVPGGVGTVTATVVIKHVVEAAARQKEKRGEKR